MKKILVLLFFVVFMSGCGKTTSKNIVENLNNKINKSKSYHLIGTLEIKRNEEIYNYDVDSSYMEKDHFKVNLINQNNNHEQIILKNENGVYVLTPSLNKSYKFQSDWPYNNSQIYLLQPIISDLMNDKNKKYEKTENGHIIISDVVYSTEKNFKKQKVYFDADKNIVKVEVVDNNDNVIMTLNIKSIDFNIKYDKTYFDASKYIVSSEKESSESENSNEKTESNAETSKLEEIVYPMYVPVDTYLTNQDVVETSIGERVILTFGGESSFTIVQENLNDNVSVNYIYGDPYLILDTVGCLTDYSVSWISNNIEYTVMSDSLETDELLTVAQSIKVEAVGK